MPNTKYDYCQVIISGIWNILKVKDGCEQHLQTCNQWVLNHTQC